MKKILIYLFLISNIYSVAQDNDWWIQKHNWDGKTHWSRYITIAPAYMGPNALPVPEIKNGNLNNSTYFNFSVENHISSGDKTQNLYTELNLPICKNKVALKFSFVPFEHYAMDSTTRDERRSIDHDGKGIAWGDVYIGTFIQLVKDHPRFPDLLLTINLKTASGNNLIAARFSDTPAYFFDLSFSREYKTNKPGLKSIRPFLMLGFYCWQTNEDTFYQNDAPLFGTGLELNFEKIKIINSIGGYAGFIGKGDKPIVYRLELRRKLSQKTDLQFKFQQGIHHFKYSTFSLGCYFNLNWFDKNSLQCKTCDEQAL